MSANASCHTLTSALERIAELEAVPALTPEDANEMRAMADAVGTEITEWDAARLNRWAGIADAQSRSAA